MSDVAHPLAPPDGGGHVEELAAALDVPSLAAHLADVLVHDAYGEVAPGTRLPALLQASCDAKVSALRDVLRGERPSHAVTSPETTAVAVELARLRVPTTTIERSYRIGQEAVWQWWLDEVDAYVARTGASATDILRATTPVMFEVIDRLLTATLETYDETVEARRRSVAERRRRLVAQVLDGELDAPGADAERLLRYRFDGHHVTAVLTAGSWRATERLAARLHDLLGAQGLLLVEDGLTGGVAWLRVPEVGLGAREAVARAVTAAEAGAAFGDPGAGVEGFRRSHADARATARVRERLGDQASAVTWPDDVRIETLGLMAPVTGRRLADAELEAVRDLSPAARETLAAWLVTGSNVAAAARLGVHEHTVRNRLREVERRLGADLRARRTELHVALRLDAVLEPAD
ncbi:CdaR family transcriptional regulator [Conexibacter sp. SYSU D00693]|uniref:PucR family transcriptional regulator n=1 Tax=Conexibacter sp. SYSU D00693 TaxID=2812560 RepID=UPI00196A864E|nr:helix-turn-helix domain-containing protein [Conexibacter sp. SYSU D00693]